MILFKKVVSIILSIICFLTSNNILGGLVNPVPVENKNVFLTQSIAGEEKAFFSRLDTEKMGIYDSVNEGIKTDVWDSAKSDFLDYCKNKFASLGFVSNIGDNDGSYRTAMYDTLCYSEDLVSIQTVSSSTFSKVTFPISKSQVSGIYLLSTFKNSIDTGILMRSKDDDIQYAPTLTFRMDDGSSVKVVAAEDAYVRATGVDNTDENATTIFGRTNKDELWAMHCVDTVNQMPFSSNEMRTYLRFDLSDISMASVSYVDLSVYAQIKNPNGGSTTSSSLPLALMVPYTKSFSEKSLTWQKIAELNGFGHYSWNGLDGIVYDETLYGNGYSNLHVPSGFVHAISKFSEITSLCISGNYDKAKDILLRFCEQTYNVIADSSNGVGGFPANSPVDAADRCRQFPYIYKTLLDNNKLSAQENFKLIKWYYQNMSYVYNEYSQTIWTDGTTPNEESCEYFSNNGFDYISGYFFGFAFFNEFTDSTQWAKTFESRLALTAGKLVNNDKSFIEVSLSSPAAVVSRCVELLNCMDNLNYSSNSYNILKHRAAQIVYYLISCTYPDGSLPDYGDGDANGVYTSIYTLMQMKDARQFITVNYPEILWYYTNGKQGIKPANSYAYKDAKIVTDRTGWTGEDSMLFFNAKGGGKKAHGDALSLLFYSKGENLLSDTGTIPYNSAKASAHNTVEVDGIAQSIKGKTVSDGFDGKNDNINMYANGGVSTIRSYTTANAGSTHYRNVTYLKEFGGMILVNDKLVPDRAVSHTYTQNWHTANSDNLKVADANNDNVRGYTESASGANLIIAQAPTTGGATITPSIKEGYDANNINGKADYFEFEQSGSGTVCFNTAIYAYNSKDIGKNIRINKLSTGVDDSVASSMNVTLYSDNNLTKQAGDIVYYNSFESAPASRQIVRQGNNGYSTNASNALYHVNTDGTVDMLSISNGSSLAVYNSNSANMSTVDERLASVYTSEPVSDLSVRYNKSNKTIEVNSSDEGVCNFTTDITVYFNQFDNAETITLNGRVISKGANVTVLDNGFKTGTASLIFDFKNDSKAETRYSDASYGSGVYNYDTGSWYNRSGKIVFNSDDEGVLSQQVAKQNNYDGFSSTYIQPSADGTVALSSACLNFDTSSSDVVQIRLRLRGAAARSDTTVQALFGYTRSAYLSWSASKTISGTSLGSDYTVINIPVSNAMKTIGNIVTFRIMVNKLTQTDTESYIDFDYIYIGSGISAPNKIEHTLYLRDTDDTLLYQKTVGLGAGYGTLPIPGKEGYFFKGWFTTPTGGTKLDETATIASESDETYYAHWEKACYNISYALSGGTLPSGLDAVNEGSDNPRMINPTLVAIESGFDNWIRVENPVMTGYDFRGWTVKGMDTSVHHYWEDYEDKISTSMSWANIKFTDMYNLRETPGTVTFVANWTRAVSTVTFDAGGGSCDTASKQVTYDDFYGILPTASKAGHTFLGWFTEPTGGTKITESTTARLTSPQTLYAHYSINSYTVEFVCDGTLLQSNKLEYGTMPSYDGETPTREADAQYTYTFSGWSPEISAVADDTTYTAQFSTTVNKYTVKWRNFDGSILKIDRGVDYGDMPDFGEAVPFRPDDYYSRHHFVGWSHEIEPVTGDVEYTAVYESENLRFNLNKESSLVMSENAGLIFGFTEDKLTEEFIKSAFGNENLIIEKVNGKIGTGTRIVLNDKYGRAMNTLTIVVIGDVDGNGRCDGMDSVLTSCMVNGMIAKDSIAKAQIFAADCNGDGYIDINDVELMEQAGLGLAEISQEFDMDTFNNDFDFEIISGRR